MALANITWALLEVADRDSFPMTPRIWPLHWALQLSRWRQHELPPPFGARPPLPPEVSRTTFVAPQHFTQLSFLYHYSYYAGDSATTQLIHPRQSDAARNRSLSFIS
jgi:hypothetical protein